MDNRNVFRDGIELPGYIKASPGLHGSCRFKYRPMLPEDAEEAEYLQIRHSNEPRKSVEQISEMMAKRIIAWSEQDENANPVPITAANIRRLAPAVFRIMFRIIAQQVPSDPDPELVPNDEPVSLREIEGN